ncbi:MAG TPA: hypothetical protein ENN06_02585 [Desulfobacteraceae bacterium]|nr:hypothetical protein [Desulfobacteraceae bacterium]
MSSRLGYQLRQVAATCPGPMVWTENKAGELQPGNVPAAEALRVVGRKRQKDGEFLQTNDRHALLQGRTDLNSLADELIIAYQIAASMDIASGVWTSGEDE